MKPWGLDKDRTFWIEWLQARGQKAFVADQILQWLFHHRIIDPSAFSNLSRLLREELQNAFDWSLPSVDSVMTSDDGSEKLLINMRDGALTEMVIMRNPDRTTLCVSSQVGCRMGCAFCQTARLGFSRNLSRGEILGQVLLADKRLQEQNAQHLVSNVVFMGMGEPLDNYEAVVDACNMLIDPKFFGLSKHRVTLSTSGLVPEIRKLGKDTPVALAISLHSADEEERSRLMPVNRRYPLSLLKEALLEYPVQTRHGITFEYLMIQGLNDSLSHAKKLVTFLHGLQAKVNLIPMNPFPGSLYTASQDTTIREFQQYLADRGIPAPVRYSRGQDVSGACGQLAARRLEDMPLTPQEIRKKRKK